MYCTSYSYLRPMQVGVSIPRSRVWPRCSAFRASNTETLFTFLRSFGTTMDHRHLQSACASSHSFRSLQIWGSSSSLHLEPCLSTLGHRYAPKSLNYDQGLAHVVSSFWTGDRVQELIQFIQITLPLLLSRGP